MPSRGLRWICRPQIWLSAPFTVSASVLAAMLPASMTAQGSTSQPRMIVPRVSVIAGRAEVRVITTLEEKLRVSVMPAPQPPMMNPDPLNTQPDSWACSLGLKSPVSVPLATRIASRKVSTESRSFVSRGEFTTKAPASGAAGALVTAVSVAIAGAAVDVAAQNRATQTSILSEAFGIFCIGMGGSHSIGWNLIQTPGRIQPAIRGLV